MVGKRVLSFMSAFSNKDRDSSRSTPSSPTVDQHSFSERIPTRQDVSYNREPKTPPPTQHQFASSERESPQTRQRANSRPISMVSTYQPPLMEVTHETLPELQPIFTFLNSHANKLYQEGYFLKLDDQNSNGRPNADRTWTECFAQLVGTVLSLWDAAELDAAGQDGEVLPKFINLTDASIKMIEALPTRNNDDQPLQHVLSISTAGKNRYLLHFNSHHSLIQWTAGIRLAMYEYATLQEAYTGALIAGKGKALNNINLIMERNRFKIEEWVRVRFGAGTPWRRCWCVITPPTEKEVNKLQKELNKKKSVYDRSRPTVLKGDVKFYDTKKVTKKTKPIATLTDAFCAYAIYPQSKPLIDQSTLIKVEGTITIHSNPPTSTEGFVFVMPEVHPAVSGFEIMLRWLFPALDTFALYGRPGRLIADTKNPNSLMFAMPSERRYGYLEILDVTGLILTDGSQRWTERQWRAGMKDLTAKRMTAIANGTRASRYSSSSRRSTMRNSIQLPTERRGHFNDAASVKSTPSIRWGNGTPRDDAPFGGPSRTDTAPANLQVSKGAGAVSHHRSVSESQGLDRYSAHGVDGNFDSSPTPPQHNLLAPQRSNLKYEHQMSPTPERVSFDEDVPDATNTPVRELQDMQQPTQVQPVATPPKFAHAAGTLPPTKPFHSPEARRAKSRMSQSTLAQMTGSIVYNPNDLPRKSHDQAGPGYPEDQDQRGVHSSYTNARRMNANDPTNEGLVTRTESPYEQPRTSDRNHENSAFTFPQHPAPATPLQRSPPSQESVDSRESHVVNSPDRPGNSTAAPLRCSTRDSVIRKPLPTQYHPTPSPSTFSSPDMIDRNGFDLIVPHGGSPTPNIGRQPSAASHYDDYNSPRTPNVGAPFSSIMSIEKPRAGVLRTVGTENQTPLSTQDTALFDFGPTFLYSTQLPTAKETPRQSSTPPPRTQSRNALSPETQYQPRTSSRQPDVRHMAWQPGMAAPPTTPSQVISPEQFVEQRAAIPVHARSPSVNALRSNTPTPPLGSKRDSYSRSRRNSSELLAQSNSRNHSRHSSGVLGSGDMSTNLSAKDQQHVARITGSPLINLPPTGRQSPQSGLVGAIEDREREKKHLKQGLSSQVVEQAIAQRQQQALHQQYYHHHQQQQQQQQQAGYGRPAAPGYSPARTRSPGGGWTPPIRTPEGMTQGQYFPPQTPPHLQQPQQHGRGVPPQQFQQNYRGPGGMF